MRSSHPIDLGTIADENTTKDTENLYRHWLEVIDYEGLISLACSSGKLAEKE